MTKCNPAGGWLVERYSKGDLRRVIAAEHTGLLERKEREEIEARFKAKSPRPWYENLLSATPTLELGVDIGDLSSGVALFRAANAGELPPARRACRTT